MKRFALLWRSILLGLLLVLSLTVAKTNTALAADLYCENGDEYGGIKLTPAQETLAAKGCKFSCHEGIIDGFISVVKGVDIQCDGVTVSDADFSGVDFFAKDNNGGWNPDYFVPSITSISFKNSKISYTEFDNANLKGANFTNAVLSNNDFVSTNLEGANFANTVVKDSFFFDANLKGLQAEKADFSADSISDNLPSNDFAGADLTGANLKNSSLQGASLEMSFTDGIGYLPPATLSHANLEGANLNYARLGGANLTGANLKNASLRETILEGGDSEGLGQVDPAILLHANLKGADLSNARLNGVYFTNANLANAKLQNVELDDTVFSDITLSGADFSGATLQGVNFSGATLNNAKFNGATIQGTPNISKRTNFECSYLGGADFSNTTVRDTNFEYAVVSSASNCKSDTSSPDGYFCGTDPFIKKAYGTTKFDNFDNSVICPDGQRGNCNSHLSFPDWTTSYCGTPQIRWFPTKQSSPRNTVNIPDSNLKQCIAQQMYNDPNAQIDTQEAQSVRAISCPGKSISNASGLDSFTALERLDLSSNNLRGGLTLNNEKILNLNLENNQLTNITLSPDAYPLELNLSYNQLSEFDLSTDNDLISADLSHNNLTSIGDDISEDDQLVELFLDNNHLTSIGNISNLVNNESLYKLSLKGNPNFECSSLGLSIDDPVYQDSGCGQ